MTGRLVLVATPIGNLGDISGRALDTLREADVIACEDTRRTRKLLTHFQIAGKRLIASHEHNEARLAESIVERVRNGETVALVSDSGTPGVSDPGQRVATAAAEAGLALSAVPGPSALLGALVVSGFGTDRFCFEGFLPRSGAERKDRIALLATESRTSVIYESPNRVAKTCAQLAESLGPDRRAALVREFTKIHEEVRRGPLGELVNSLAGEELRGECVLVLEGATTVAVEATDDDIAKAIDAHPELSTKDVAATVAFEMRVPKSRVYAIAAQRRKP